MEFQRERNPELVLAEKRAIEHPAQGYPSPAHGIAFDAEEIICAALDEREA